MSEVSTYDATGNKLVDWQGNFQPVTTVYDAASRLVTGTDGPTFVTWTYDNNGNMTLENRAGTLTERTYNRENRLVVEMVGVGKTTMSYDGDGLRRTRQTPSVLTTFIWDGSDYLSETSSS